MARRMKITRPSYLPAAWRRGVTASAPAALALVVLGAASAAQGEPVFSPDATETCVAEQTAQSPNRGDHAVLGCVGRAAEACFLTPGADTTLGMMDCLKGELAYWDDRLNRAHDTRLAAARALDAEFTTRTDAASQGDSLIEMQQAWIAFRDAACLYERAQWMGGSLGGPATLACHMTETARQTLRLEGWWAQ